MKIALALLLLVFAFPAFAVDPSEVLPNPALEARAREIGRALRCVVCQNQSIDDSNAEVARDMRRAVRERLVAGDNDAAGLVTLIEQPSVRPLDIVGGCRKRKLRG